LYIVLTILSKYYDFCLILLQCYSCIISTLLLYNFILVILQFYYVNIMTILTNRPNATVKWMKAGQEITFSKRIVYRVDKEKHTLTIKDCTLADEGEYTVVAGDDKATATYALDPVDSPGRPVALNITRHEVTLSWTKPEGDGGFSITGYTVERKEMPNGRWLKANFNNILETMFTVSGLTEEATYEFRVLARNSAGAVSAPSQPSEAITCRDDIEEPRLDIDASYSSNVVVMAGEPFKLEASVTGRPIPSLVWTKEGKELEDTICDSRSLVSHKVTSMNLEFLLKIMLVSVSPALLVHSTRLLTQSFSLDLQETQECLTPLNHPLLSPGINLFMMVVLKSLVTLWRLACLRRMSGQFILLRKDGQPHLLPLLV
uniref:Fibronectin type-III domain-containing protein n=1 Tax=Xiphophorus couchianus TaxID=32473 RepID=A0A3B5MIV0_9TELE